MAEKRMISKVISISEKVNNLPDVFDILLFTWMIPHTDDFGRMAGSPGKVKALVVPMLDKTKADVQASLERLDKEGLIFWYEVDGERIVQIINFEKHQQGLQKRTTSKFPELPRTSENFTKIPSELKRTELKRTELKGTEEKGIEENITEKTAISTWINLYKIKCKGIYELERAESFIGILEIQLIELIMKRSEGKSIPYFESIAKESVQEGIYTLDAWNLKNSKKSDDGRLDFMKDI
ncbi:hypothetical protein [Paenibacillus macquariensis]|uniref:Uncharacterized protein n=1 Tax=Paenibacillus macquariensis TaxID=948756 RepID=A0ABY1KET7_9BACL|nr:hypothetical protein [Paenibacillus macquariensis]MEC0092477.1 hypothetical protein [Paenibacillus macquariensis]OAB35435.1 hypothetical protein PMSM_09265 [Paenibacillus macquariensis subsp. macquariensis]SIR72640.1 hypothetical protein SAMN05421578_1488 [Paenibacillus macquariensis]